MAHKKRASDKNGECKVKSLRSLRRLLSRHNVNFSKWGEGKSKTINRLMQEIRDGETRLFIKRGKLVRYSRHAQAHVFCDRTGVLFQLREDRRVFGDLIEPGRPNRPAVSEKIMRGESPRKGMIRGIQEELGLKHYKGDGLWQSSRKPKRSQDATCASYPGLTSIRFEFLFLILLPVQYFNYSGYVERQHRKVTYFAWGTADNAKLVASLSGEFPAFARERNSA